MAKVVIEFNERLDSRKRAAAIRVDEIVLMQALDGDSTSIVLDNGRTVLADHPYRYLRRIILEARSQFATLL